MSGRSKQSALLIGSGVASGLVAYLVIELTTDLDGLARWLVVGGVALVFIATTWFLSAQRSPDRDGIDVGSGVRSGGDTLVGDVDITTSTDKPIRIADDTRAQKDVRITGIRIRNRRQR